MRYPPCMQAEPGRVYLVGAGPGDPGLITVAGAAYLATADVVLYDALAPRELLRGTKPGAALIPVGKRAGRPSMAQDEINALIIRRAMAGKSVVRLKGGDPFVFGRGGEEALACFENEVPFSIVPGVTSAIAAAAYAGIPVTHRQVARSFLVLTGSEEGAGDEGIDWTAAAAAGTIILLMGNRKLKASLERLIAAGRPPETPAAVICQGTRTSQQLLRSDIAHLGDLAAEANLPGPSLVVIGETVELADELRWFRPGPLAGRTVAVTRAAAQTGGLVAMLESEGAEVVEVPVVSSHFGAEDELCAALDLAWDWVLFTSANAVEALRLALVEREQDVRVLGAAKVASIGPGTTAALASVGLRPDFEPSRAIGRVLAEELPNPRRARILYPTSSLTNDDLAAELRLRGAAVTQLVAYRTVTELLDAHAIEDLATAHAITFTSPSTALGLAESLGANTLLPGVKLVSIGPRTSITLGECLGRVDGEASEQSLRGLVDAVIAALAPRKSRSWA